MHIVLHELQMPLEEDVSNSCTGWHKKNGQSTILYYVRGLFFSWHPVEYLKSYLLTISFAKEYYFKLIEPIKITLFWFIAILVLKSHKPWGMIDKPF